MVTIFFKSASYTIEAICAQSFEESTEKLKDVEAQILAKRNELRIFETEYRKALARFQEVTNRYAQEKQAVDELLKLRDNIQSSFTASTVAKTTSSSNTSKPTGEDAKIESPKEDSLSDGKDKSNRKKWFNLNFKGEKKT